MMPRRQIYSLLLVMLVWAALPSEGIFGAALPPRAVNGVMDLTT